MQRKIHLKKNSQKFQMGESLITYKVKMVVNIALLLTVDFCYKNISKKIN